MSKITTFIIRELQNVNSSREGVEIQAEDLSAAKRAASKAQCFHGTVMVVESESGSIIAKKTGNTWINA